VSGEDPSSSPDKDGKQTPLVYTDGNLLRLGLLGLGHMNFKDSIPIGGLNRIMLDSLREIEGTGEFPCQS